MKILKFNDKTDSEVIRVNKPIGSLLIKTQKDLADLDTEKITIEIERLQGENVVIAARIPLKEFILSRIWGNSAGYQSTEIDTTYNCHLCPLSETGFAVHLNADEALLIRLEGCEDAQWYFIEGVEEPLTVDSAVHFERKACLAGEESRVFNVENYETVVFSNFDQIYEVLMTYENGAVIKRTNSEMTAISRNCDPLLSIGDENVVLQSVPDMLVYPLIGIVKLEVFKTTSELCNVLFTDEKQD